MGVNFASYCHQWVFLVRLQDFQRGLPSSLHTVLFFYAKDMHGINLSARFTVESIKTELFTSFQYYLHNIYINTYLIKAVKIFLECNIDLVSLLLNPGKVQVIPFRDISLCCFSVFSVMLNIKKVQLSMPPAERRQSQG